MAAITDSLRKLAYKLGVTEEADTIEELVNLINDTIGSDKGNDIADALDSYADAIGTTTPLGKVTLSAMEQEEVPDDVAVSVYQADDVTVSNGAITGSLYEQQSGMMVDTFGEGYYACIHVSDIDEAATSVKIGLVPTRGSGLVEIITDPDKDCVFKVSDKDNQVLKVVSTDGTRTQIQLFDLSGLTLVPANEG